MKYSILFAIIFLLAVPTIFAQGMANAQQQRIQSGNYDLADGTQVQIQEQANNRLQIHTNTATANTDLEMVQEQNQERTQLKVKLSNGNDFEVKVMPDVASQRAIERLRLNVCSTENNCQIELKEVAQQNQARAAYEIKAEKQSRVLGLFQARMQVQAQVDAETGEIIRTQKPWWAFLATED